MRGKPVGVLLSQVLLPLGQLLLELGKVDSAQFVKAQRLIGDGERLPGQVFMEIGAITEAELKDTLALQARRKAQKFVSMRAGGFEFTKGLTSLTGFKSLHLEAPPLLYQALAASVAGAHQVYLERFAGKRLRAAAVSLGSPLDSFGFGQPEERFLLRLAQWHTVRELDLHGTLPTPSMAALLRYLDHLGQLETAAPAPSLNTPEPRTPEPKTPEPGRPLHTAEYPRDVSGLRQRPSTKEYGPAPASAIQLTSARDISGLRKVPSQSNLPSVVVDLEGPAPGGGKKV